MIFQLILVNFKWSIRISFHETRLTKYKIRYLIINSREEMLVLYECYIILVFYLQGYSWNNIVFNIHQETINYPYIGYHGIIVITDNK